MGAGASKKDKELEPVQQENKWLVLISKCLKDLPFPTGSITEQVIQNVISKAERVELLADQDIIKKGQRSTGIYIILSGEVHVLSSTATTLATLLPGDFFGEISTLFYIPCTAHVKTKSKAVLILLKTENLQRSLNDIVVNMDMAAYYVSKRYLDTNGTLSQPELMHRIAVSALKQIPMFQNWAESATESLVQMIETDSYESLVIFPAGSVIQQLGQPANEITVITRGSVELQHSSGKVNLNVKRWPIWIAEEGLYSGVDRQYSVKASTVCQAIIINNSHITDIADRYKSGAGLTLTKTLDQWSKLYERWSPELFKKYQAHLQIETILKYVGDCQLLQDVPVGFLYSLVIASAVHEYQEDITIVADKDNLNASLKRSNSKRKSMKKESAQGGVSSILKPGQFYANVASDHFKEEDRFLLLFEGSVKVKYSGKSSGNLLETGKLFYIPSSKMMQCTVIVKSTAILLRFTGTVFLHTCKDYPKAILNLPNKSR
ncbi:cGMP-dependent protein kinase 1-like [Antedon mediterranea]|uniref:cGMP-dependent protein kinase 1-like n=1 Tax=Antedon mediterranea TaxID=105859 RepID=UPI003AF6CDFD